MANDFIEKFKNEFEKALEHFQNELKVIRTNRANPDMVENILVEAYSVKTPLKQLASIGVPEARTLVIEPWDKSIIKEIEKAITHAEIGLNPSNEGNFIRITIPQMTEENRKMIVKNIKEKLEKARVSIRQVREKIREEILAKEKDKEITEDDKFRHMTDLDNMTTDYNKKAENMSDGKEKEVMTI